MLANPAVALQGASVLDFGCGTRPYEAWFKCAGAEYYGADIDGAHDVLIRDDGSLAAADASFNPWRPVLPSASRGLSTMDR
jgi:hypothetical protein